MNPEVATHTIAFYNTENLFDVFMDEKSNDNDFLPTSAKNWTLQRFDRKIFKLGSVISKIGFPETQKPPVLVGLAEVENDAVLQNLIKSEDLKHFNYGFIHYNSLDERGIDVALLYNKDEFTIESSKALPIFIEDEHGVRDFTRDILLVIGYLQDKKIHVLVNHWPSRHEGKDQTEYKRVIAGARLAEVLDSITKFEADAQIIVLGDFNDNPNSPSILKLKSETGLNNTMETVWSFSRGSVNHNFVWIQFDQIFLTSNFLDKSGAFQFLKADIFDEKFLTQNDGKFKGQPFRTYLGKKYKGGFSDHFPVYIQIGKSMI
ncbi:MAG: endonuclease [Aquaticitalea sp.]